MSSVPRKTTRSGFTLRLVFAIPLLFVPAVVIASTPFARGTELAFVALIPALLALLWGPRFALFTAVATALVAVLVELANPSPAAAIILMVLIGLAVGASGLRGWHTVATVVCSWPAVLLIGPPLRIASSLWSPSSPGNALLAGAIALLGGLWTVGVGVTLLHDLPRTQPVPLPRNVSVVYALALALLLGVATFGATTWGHGTMAGWILLTIFVVARPGYSDSWHRIVNRTAGTLAGGVVAALLSLVIPSQLILGAIGFIALAAAIVLQLKKSNYSIYSFALTAAIVLLNSHGASVFALDIQRVLFTIVGALLTAVVVAVLELALSRRHLR